jgi:hypothetical protein
MSPIGIAMIGDILESGGPIGFKKLLDVTADQVRDLVRLNS